MAALAVGVGSLVAFAFGATALSVGFAIVGVAVGADIIAFTPLSAGASFAVGTGIAVAGAVATKAACG